MSVAKWLQDDKPEASHDRFVDRAGRKLALPLLLIFSAGALISITRQAMERIFQVASAGGVPNILDMTSVIITFAIIAVGDLLMVSAAGKWADARANRQSTKVQSGPALIVFLVALIEAVTFVQLVSTLEAPQDIWHWGTIIGRGALGPLCTIWFAMSTPRIPTEEERNKRTAYKISQTIDHILDSLDFSGVQDLSMIPALQQMQHWLNGTWNEDAKSRIGEFMRMLQTILPDSAAQQRMMDDLTAEHAQVIERLSAKHEQTITQLKAEVSHAYDQAAHQVMSALVATYGTGIVPAWITQRYPELDGMVLASIGNAARKPARSLADRAPKAPTNSEQLLDILAQLSIQPAKKPNPNSKDIWVKSSAIEVLSNGHITNGAQTELAQRLGDGAMDGRAYIVPMRKLVAELRTGSRLHPLLIEWDQRRQSDQDDATLDRPTGEYPVIIARHPSPELSAIAAE